MGTAFRWACMAGVAISALATPANSAQRNVCFNLKFADARYNWPAPNVGVLRGCQSGADMDAVGHQIELWDKDNSRPDALIGAWYIGGTGTQCASFEWEGSPASAGKANPN